jgi:hypothetical protein
LRIGGLFQANLSARRSLTLALFRDPTTPPEFRQRSAAALINPPIGGMKDFI